EIKLTTKKRIQNGFNYLIIGPSTGVIRGEFFEIKMDGNILTFKTEEKVRKNNKLYLIKKNEENFR
ncbi:MAG: hypothetical protein PHH12_02135, partial [Candidatus Shapirobacteria bacterium]|nr:hypothetical protein [Candidatus Shapirobacteria bacterium]